MTDATLIPFQYKEAPVRTVWIDGKPWFVLVDLCSVLHLSNPGQVVSRLGDGVTSSYPIADSLGRIQDTTIVNESGMYRVVLRSDKPEALAFQAWITDEVLPSIREKGSYSLPGATPAATTSFETQARVLDILKNVIAKDYLEAKAKIVLARTMGDTPEIEASARPLYVQDYLREKGATADEVKRCSSSFGRYVREDYVAERGVEPGKRFDETSSGQVREVYAYTEADRPIFDRAWSESYANGFPEKKDKKTKKNKEKK